MSATCVEPEGSYSRRRLYIFLLEGEPSGSKYVADILKIKILV